MPSDDLSSRVVALEGVLARTKQDQLEVASLRERLAVVEALARPETAPDLHVLKQQVASLQAEKIALEDRLRAVAAPRLETTPVQLSDSFRAAALALRDGLAPRPGDRGAFALADLQVEMKAMLAVGDDGGLRFVLPAPGEKPDAQSLSALRFTLRASAEAAPPTELIAVPMLLGLPRAAAEIALARAGLKPGAVTEGESDYAPGSIIAQDPEPGVEIPADIPVALVLAAPATVAVPDLAGLALADATAGLDAVGLALGAVQGAGLVVAQRPVAGTRLPRGASVALTLDPPLRQVPDLTGLTGAEAEAALKAAELVPGSIGEAPGGQAGHILAQVPKAGTEVPPGSKIAFTLGVGAKTEVGVEEMIDRAVKAASESRSGISGRLLRERLTRLKLGSGADFAALATASDEDLQKAIGAPTPRGLADARAALRKALGE